MKTEVIMKREIFGKEISQKSKTEFFSATDLERAGNLWRFQNNMPKFNMNMWFSSKETKSFIKSLEKKFGLVKINSKGKNSHTWIHPYLFIDMALAISPDLKIEVYSWLYDHLIKYRNDSGDSYKKMCGALYENTKSKTKFYKEISEIAEKIKKHCGVLSWEKASESQLKLRDKIHENIALLCDVLKHNEKAVELAIEKTKIEFKKGENNGA